MTSDRKRRLLDACDDLRAQRAGLDVIIEHPERHPVMKFRLQQGRVIVALSRVLELRALALCDDGKVRG